MLNLLYMIVLLYIKDNYYSQNKGRIIFHINFDNL